MLPNTLTNTSRFSQEFYDALYEVALVPDCVSNSNAIDISHRTHFEFKGQLTECRARYLGLQYPEEADQIDVLCPADKCLGTFCRFNVSNCLSTCSSYFVPSISSEESCPTETHCNTSDIEDPRACFGEQKHSFTNSLI